MFRWKNLVHAYHAFVAGPPKEPLLQRCRERVDELEESILNKQLDVIKAQSDIECAQRQRSVLRSWIGDDQTGVQPHLAAVK
jgi:hypothetical protein